jgi:5-methylcytosine-specific restriction enzyme A
MTLNIGLVSETMARNPTWSRDELILALDLYLRHRERLPDSNDAEIVELSQTLNSLFGDQAKDASLFRNHNGVYMKLANFRAVDPMHTSQGKRGLSRGGAGVAELWEEFSNHGDELKLIASAIREAAAAGISPQPDDDDEMAEALEGRLLTRMHLTRERNRVLIRKKREAVLRETGRLACEVCSFDFSTTYGTHGTGFIEVHHVSPLHTLKPGSRTRLQDLAVLCANCHRMIHFKPNWLTVSALKEMLRLLPEDRAPSNL